MLLFLLGFAFVATALAIWLWAPDDERPIAATQATHKPPADVPPLPRKHRHVAAAAAAVAVATPRPPTPPPEAAPTEAPTEAPTIASPEEVATASPVPVSATAAPIAGRARLAIIIDDCGQWPVTERGFVALPFPVTLSVLPHVRFGPEIARDASAAGKGVMLHLPMQTISGQYPGPGTITVTMADAAIRGELESDLAELPQAQGVNNHEGSLATQNVRVMTDIADVLAQDHRYFIDSRTTGKSVGESVAREHGVPAAARDVFLDNVDDEAAVEAQMRVAVREAQRTGSAIAIGHPRPATLAAVKAIGLQAQADGVELTLASTLVH